MLKRRAIEGDWIGAIYWLGGERTEWTLSLDLSGTYHRTVVGHSGDIRESGTWSFDANSDVLDLVPDGTDQRHQWWVLDITKCERSNTMLVLRHVALASRNLPILLYRVHRQPDELTSV